MFKSLLNSPGGRGGSSAGSATGSAVFLRVSARIRREAASHVLLSVSKGSGTKIDEVAPKPQMPGQSICVVRGLNGSFGAGGWGVHF